jgi:hypothetical protein
MSAPKNLPKRHLNIISSSLPSSPSQTSQFEVRPSITDRFSHLLSEIESFLLVCTYEEMCSFWNAIANIRQCLQKTTNPSEVPQFLSGRRKQRDFSRLLEVLADLPYPKLHLSTQLAKHKGDRRRRSVNSDLATHN